MSAARGRPAPAIPFCDLNRLEVLEVGGDRARCATTVGAWLDGAAPLGIPAGAAALADMVLMYASLSRCTPGLMPVTASLRLDLWSDPPEVGSRLVGEAGVDGADGDLLLVTGRISHGDRVVATATTRSMMVPVAGTGARSREEGTEGPDRPAAGSDRSTGRTGLAALNDVLDLPAARLAGLDVVEAAEGAITLAARPGKDLERTGGVLHGGAVPLLASLASSALLAGSLPEGSRARRLDLTADYVRPTMIASDLVVRSLIMHRSRRLIKVHSEISGSDGRVTARAYETAAVEPTV